jgi:putative chitinase
MYVQEPSTKLKDVKRSSVMLIQKQLIDLGLLAPPVDGIAGPLTHAAWAKFKRMAETISLDLVTDRDLNNLKYFVDIANKYNGDLVTEEELTAVFRRQPTDEQVADLNKCLIKNEINTPARIAHFLSQTGHESGGLRWLVEIDPGHRYENRRDLGNIRLGDGVKFKGAGSIMLTGRYNYQAFANYVGDQKVMEGHQYVAKHYPFSSAGWFWTTRKLNKLCDDGASVAAITRVVNGGSMGLADRLAYYDRAKKMLDQRQSFLVQAVLQQ